jgi:targeting protein for Xklp2
MQILESKGDIGVFAHPKPQVTAPKEFHFSTDVRLGPPSVADLFDKVVIQNHSVVIPFNSFLIKLFLRPY